MEAGSPLTKTKFFWTILTLSMLGSRLDFASIGMSKVMKKSEEEEVLKALYLSLVWNQLAYWT